MKLMTQNLRIVNYNIEGGYVHEYFSTFISHRKG